jgi:hypothetical protein
MKVSKQQAKQILQKLSPEELALYKQLNAELGGVNENVLSSILSNWKTYSTAMLMAIMMNSNMASAINKTSPEIYNAIRTEVLKDTTKATSSTVPGSVKTVEFGQSFASGKATLTNKQDLIQKVTELKDWMKGKDVSNFKIVIAAGESQVTNQKGYEQKGSLAQARANEVIKIVDKLGFKKVDTDIKIGDTPYKQGDDPNDPSYTAEQFVTINIVVDNDVCSMQDINGGGAVGTSANDYITSTNYISGKGELVLDTGQVPDRLVVVDSNGNVKQDTGYITTQASKYKDWKYTPMYILELTKAYIDKSKAISGSKIKIITVSDYQDLLRQLKNNPDQDKVQMLGEEIAPALKEMEQMINQGQKQFVIYDLGTSQVKVQFDQSRGESAAIVYSPIGKTGYTVTGACQKK